MNLDNLISNLRAVQAHLRTVPSSISDSKFEKEVAREDAAYAAIAKYRCRSLPEFQKKFAIFMEAEGFGLNPITKHPGAGSEKACAAFRAAIVADVNNLGAQQPTSVAA